MFSFLNRQSSKSDMKPAATEAEQLEQTIQAECEDIQKNLYTAIVNKRTDIVVTLINEWFKGESSILKPVYSITEYFLYVLFLKKTIILYIFSL